MRAIFISYRREDAEGQAGRLFTDLAKEFGRDAVFMDVTGIEPGRDFRRSIDEHVASCGVLLAVIGRDWLDAKDASGRRRLDDPKDFVRLETASALKRDIPVIPVLVQGASMPEAEQLPGDLTDLAFRNAVELTHARWDSDVQVLASALRRYVQAPGTPAPAATIETRPPAAAAPPLARKTIAIAAAVVVALVLGGYAWYSSSSSTTDEASTDTPSIADKVAETDDTKAADGAQGTASPPDTGADKTSDNAADHSRIEWRSYEFPPPNAGATVFAIMPDGNPACASYDEYNCLWGIPKDKIDFGSLKPLECGDMHRAKYGVTGYEDSAHWCSIARKLGRAGE